MGSCCSQLLGMFFGHCFTSDVWDHVIVFALRNAHGIRGLDRRRTHEALTTFNLRIDNDQSERLCVTFAVRACVDVTVFHSFYGKNALTLVTPAHINVSVITRKNRIIR